MADSYTQFEQRVRMLNQKHAKRTRGVVTYVNDDGLIVAKPRRRVKVPVKGPLLFIAVFLFFKGFLLANLGLTAYEDRVNVLAQGTAIEQLGAKVMRADPASIYIAQQLRPYLR